MNAVSLGPIVMAADRFAVILGMFTFIIVTGILARRIDQRFNAWSWWVLIGGIVAARAGHVLVHWQSFAAEPLRMFALWEGGFHWPTALAAIALSVFLVLEPRGCACGRCFPWRSASSSGTPPCSSPAKRRRLPFPPRHSKHWRATLTCSTQNRRPPR